MCVGLSTKQERWRISKVSASLNGEISCSSCSVHGSECLLVDALKTSVTLITLSSNAGRKAVLKQVYSREVKTTDL